MREDVSCNGKVRTFHTSTKTASYLQGAPMQQSKAYTCTVLLSCPCPKLDITPVCQKLNKQLYIYSHQHSKLHHFRPQAREKVGRGSKNVSTLETKN